ncbi:hypothetical protein [Bdellovibrio sp. HCB337]|uniref:hypothetical protein n=1 Tax=Bdellovibrio sp. HCB337 TaxID=3394358 RepID=UPI0039A73FFA
MFKKLALFTLIAMTSFSFRPSVAAEKPEQIAAKIRMKAFLCYYFDCPESFMEGTGLKSVVDMYGSQRALMIVHRSQNDARFFADRTLMTEPGKEATDLYKRILIKLQPSDRITMQNSQQGEVLLNTKNLQVLDFKNGEGPGVKINGRPLISRDLEAAHSATQNLIFDGVIKAPMNEYKLATDALLINRILVDFPKDR